LDRISQDELEGLVIKLIGILRHIINREYAFTRAIDVKQNEILYETLSNPIDTFYREHCIEDPDGSIPKPEFKEKLETWMRKNGHRHCTEVEIAEYMKSKEIEYGRRIIAGHGRPNAWLGIRWKD
jgi:hypothetical protein